MKSQIWFHVSQKYPCMTLYIFFTDQYTFFDKFVKFIFTSKSDNLQTALPTTLSGLV